ncbi:TetR/AcrR family transcriptional regulator [Malaciobacter mytili]|uniref:HTH tetR-type domain-containing protein n=1 Tax=Malaciobacter mytili LMG 24559 TaxID=1032238 RepID=A0AAX2AFM6_9BACT|nr:TetR/AcrR family transcriptional regulator [Malaciobacter mytili]AXH15508.1 transcriptional regulator, TetR/AcrR family [Malaciobacter mytili LMG 24559]RXK15192.1 hypothetical protein CP985_09875 [Malaciobacter mytili LMG 24559]
MTKEKIKKAALKNFAINGYEATSLAKIAQEVGIKKQSISTYFSQKEELYFAVFQEMTNDYITYLEKVVKQISTKPADIKIKTLVYKIYEFAVTYPLYNMFFNRALHFSPTFLQEKIKNEIQKMETLSSKIYKETFNEGIKTGLIKKQELESLVAAFYCLIDGISIQMLIYEKEEFHKRLESIWNIFWEGIKK